MSAIASWSVLKERRTSPGWTRAEDNAGMRGHPQTLVDEPLCQAGELLAAFGGTGSEAAGA
jgi:hypothetical protein